MIASVHKLAGTPQSASKDSSQTVFELGNKAFDLMKEHGTPPYPSTYALWFSYVAGSNDKLVSVVDSMLDRPGHLSTYEFEEVWKKHSGDSQSVEITAEIGRSFHTELAAALQLIQKGMTSSNDFRDTLSQIENGLPHAVAPEQINKVISRLMLENRRMSQQSHELSRGLQDTKQQLEKLNSELAEVRNQSMRDPLTAVANRRAFDTRLDAEIVAAEKGGSSFCLVLADIDHFKRVNDTFGHRVGDEVLKIFASTVTNNVKGQDMVARYGGEEFAVILPQTSIEAADKLIDRIRQQFSERRLLVRQSKKALGQVSASFGIARFKPGRSAQFMVERADEKLYEAKRSGRNRVCAEVS